MLGTQEECKKHTVEIKLADKTGKQVNTFRDHPLPIEMSEEELKTAGGCQISNSFKRKICSPRVSNSKKTCILYRSDLYVSYRLKCVADEHSVFLLK